MAISSQKRLTTASGVSLAITKLSENSYTVMEKDANGKLLRSENVKPGQTQVTLGSASLKQPILSSPLKPLHLPKPYNKGISGAVGGSSR